MQEKCRKCGAILFNKVLIDDEGHSAIDEKTPLPLESEAGVELSSGALSVKQETLL